METVCDDPVPMTALPTKRSEMSAAESNGQATEVRRKTEKTSHVFGLNSSKLRENASKLEKSYQHYDPYEHYHQKHPTTFRGTVFHLLKASFGTGILAMPNAFHNAGWLLGILGTLAVGCLCAHNIQILVSSEYRLCKKRRVPSMTYPETMECAFEEGPRSLRWLAAHFKFMTNLFLILYQIGISSVYFVFMATNFKQVCDAYMGVDAISVRWVMVYLLLPMVLICWVRHLKLLVPFSTAANAVGVLSFIIICVYIFDELPSFNQLEPIGSMRTIPLYFGTVLFAMEAVGAVFPLKNTMEEPGRFGGLYGVLSVSMVSVTLSYTFLGFFGYLKYGSDTKASITLNLPMEDAWSKAVKILYSLSIYVTYALSNFVIFDILWTNGIKMRVTSEQNKIVREYAVRTGIVMLTFVLAVAVPDLELFISFTGSFCLSTIGIAFPAIAETLVHWYTPGSTSHLAMLLFKNAIIVLIAVIAFTIGVSTAVIEYFAGER